MLAAALTVTALFVAWLLIDGTGYAPERRETLARDAARRADREVRLAGLTADEQLDTYRQLEAEAAAKLETRLAAIRTEFAR